MQTVIDKQEHEIKRLKRKKDKSGDEPSSPTPTHRDQGGNNSPRSSDSNDAESKINADELSLIEKHVYTVEPFFTNNTSNAASALFRTLLSWKAFQSPRSKFLPRLAESIEVAIKVCTQCTTTVHVSMTINVILSYIMSYIVYCITLRRFGAVTLA